MSQEFNVKGIMTNVFRLKSDIAIYIHLTHVDLAIILSIMGDVQRGLTK